VLSQCTGRAKDVNGPQTRYPYKVSPEACACLFRCLVAILQYWSLTDSTTLNQITLGQSAIEQVYIDNLAEYGVSIERPIVPISIVQSTDPEDLGGIDTHPVEVRLSYRAP